MIDVCLRKLLIDHDTQGAIDYVKRTISDLLQNKIDMSELVITKALSKTGIKWIDICLLVRYPCLIIYHIDYTGKQAHVELAERMKKRDAGKYRSRRVSLVIL